MSTEMEHLVNQLGGAEARAASAAGSRRKNLLKLYKGAVNQTIIAQLINITQKYYMVFHENVGELHQSLLNDKLLTEKATGKKGLDLPYPSGFRDVDEVIITIKSFLDLHQRPIDEQFLVALEIFQEKLRDTAKHTSDTHQKLVMSMPSVPKTAPVARSSTHIQPTLVKTPDTLPISVQQTKRLNCPVCDTSLEFNPRWYPKFGCPSCSTQIQTADLVRCPDCHAIVAPGPFKDVRIDSFPCSNTSCSNVLRHPRYGEPPEELATPQTMGEEPWVKVSRPETPLTTKKSNKWKLSLKNMFKRGGGGYDPYEYISNAKGQRFAITSTEGRNILLKYTYALFGDNRALVGGDPSPSPKTSPPNTKADEIYIRRNAVLASIVAKRKKEEGL